MNRRNFLKKIGGAVAGIYLSLGVKEIPEIKLNIVTYVIKTNQQRILKSKWTVEIKQTTKLSHGADLINEQIVKNMNDYINRKNKI